MANEAVEMEPSGRVLPIFRGEYDAGRTYENPDIVLYRNSSYVAKQVTVGNPPPAHALADDYWQMVARGIIDADISESTVEFEEAKERANIKSGEKSNIIMGKIMKFFTDLKDIAFSGSYSDLYNKPLSLPASDVYTWAKQATKPAYTKSEVGLGNVNNTSDKDKPVSTAQQTALDKKVNFTDITRSTAVNIAGKKALDAMEKNPSVEGTLAHDISQIYSNFENYLPAYFEYVGSAEGIGNSLDIPRGAKELYIVGNTPYYSIPIFLTAGQLTLYESVLGGGGHYIRFSVNRNGSGKIVITDAMQDGSTSNNARIALWYR